MAMRYHRDPKVDAKIIALFKWFDVERKKLSLKFSLRLLNTWVLILVGAEEYELAEAFIKHRKSIILRKLRMLRRSNRKFSQHLRLLRRIYRMKLKLKIKRIFS